MYADFGHQISQLGRFCLAFVALYVAAPQLLWRIEASSLLDRFWQGFVRMVAFSIAIIYVLTLTKLYEVLSFAFCMLLLLLSRLWFDPDRDSRLQQLQRFFAKNLYDLLDGVTQPVRELGSWLGKQTLRTRALMFDYLRDPLGTGERILLLLVLGYSAYLRFYDAVVHAAPAMSDAYVTLAWLKYIERRVLFHDGIYPQGFHIILSTLHKFAGQNALYTLKYAGPLCGVLTTLGLYYVVWRLTGRKSAGLMAAMVYGVLGAWLPMEWARQASTNSQEFALVFLVPAWYWSHRYILQGKRSDWWSALASYLIIGWVHTLVYLFLFVGLACVAVVHLITHWRSALKRGLRLIGAALLSGILAALPLGLGLLLGREFHQASLDFVMSRASVAPPELNWLDWLALTGIVVYPLVIYAQSRKREIVTALFLGVLGLSAIAVYWYLGPVTGNAVLVTRASLLWSLTAAIGCGAAWISLLKIVPSVRRARLADIVLTVSVCCLAVYTLKPQPALPYKMQWNSLVEQKLRIAREFRPTEWMIVSASEGYALALGQGYHMMLGDFLRDYRPTQAELVRKTENGYEKLVTPDVFLFREKVVFKPDLEQFAAEFQHLTAEYERREEQYCELRKWVAEYSKVHADIGLFYEDDLVEVWRINLRPTSNRQAGWRKTP